jgi:hypothetical protein
MWKRNEEAPKKGLFAWRVVIALPQAPTQLWIKGYPGQLARGGIAHAVNSKQKKPQIEIRHQMYAYN